MKQTLSTKTVSRTAMATAVAFLGVAAIAAGFAGSRIQDREDRTPRRTRSVIEISERAEQRETTDVTSRPTIDKRTEAAYIRTLQDSGARETLTKLLNHRLKPGDRYDADGNIVTKINGKTRTMLGYQAMKERYEMTAYPQQDWPELKEIETMELVSVSELMTSKVGDIKEMSITNEEPGSNLLNNNNVGSSLGAPSAEMPSLKLGYCCRDDEKEIFVFSKSSCPDVNNNYFEDNTGWDEKIDLPMCKELVRLVKQDEDYEYFLGHYGFELDSGVTEKCLDGIDNDGDGMVDCKDALCKEKEFCKNIDVNNVIKEDCFNNVDDDGDGEMDCNESDHECIGAVSAPDVNGREAICEPVKENSFIVGGKRRICGTSNTPYGTVLAIEYYTWLTEENKYKVSQFQVMCIKQENKSVWIESDSDGEIERKGNYGQTVNEGNVIKINDCEVLATGHDTLTSCMCMSGIDGMESAFYADANETKGDSQCYLGKWMNPSKIQVVENFNFKLTNINPSFKRDDFNPMGFMYWAPELYEAGSFPLLPHLTSARDQGIRGTCGDFADIAVVEILMLNRPDLSEQHRLYEGLRVGQVTGSAGKKLGHYPINATYEQYWPYNKKPCNSYFSKDGTYYSDIIDTYIPCSDTHHQAPIDENFVGPKKNKYEGWTKYSGVVGHEFESCVVSAQIAVYGTDEQKIERLALILKFLKYPLTFHLMYGDGEVKDGFVGNDVYGGKNAEAHAMTLVGFVHKDDIPAMVKLHPAFEPNEHYFIVKNSWGSDHGDNGFEYVTASEFIENTSYYLAYRYDLNSNFLDFYSECDSDRKPGAEW